MSQDLVAGTILILLETTNCSNTVLPTEMSFLLPFLSFPFLSCIRKHEKGSCSQTDYTRHNNSPNHYRVWSYTISSTISCFYGDKRLQCPSYIWSARYSFRKKHLGSSLVQKFVRPTGLRKIMNVILGLLLRLNRHAHYISFLSSHRFFVVFVILFW